MYSNQTAIKSISSSENSSANKANKGLYLEDNRKIEPVQMQSATSGNVTGSATVVQRGIAKNKRVKKDPAKERRKKQREYVFNPGKRYDDTLKNIKSAIKYADRELESIKVRLDDDEDIDLLGTYQKKFRIINREAFKTRLALGNVGMGRTRSQNPEQNRNISILDGYLFTIDKLLKQVRQLFPTNSGGFGAKGRAHKMEVKIDPVVKTGLTKDNSFVNNFTTGGKTIKQNIYKKAPKVAKEAAKSSIIGGQNTSNVKDKGKALKNLESRLSDINTPQVKNFKNTPVGMGRGDGQFANMANTNATGYAYLANVPGWQTQRWEWLHIRGAGLGGATDSTNLVAGTRDANTHMIPFESNIRILATAVANNPNYKSLDVEWSANSQYGAAKHAYRELFIKWKLNRATTKVKDITGEAKFNPLVVGSNISKSEVDLIEGALKEVRDSI